VKLVSVVLVFFSSSQQEPQEVNDRRRATVLVEHSGDQAAADAETSGSGQVQNNFDYQTLLESAHE
jgi:hypothetical protein